MQSQTNDQDPAEECGNEAELRAKLAQEEGTKRRQELLKLLWKLTRPSEANTARGNVAHSTVS